MKQFLKALDAGFTAFCNELWLPIFGFHLFDDPADALEDDDEDEWEDLGDYPPRPRNYSKCEKCGNDMVLRHYCDVPVELAGSLGAPGDKPTGSATPEATAGGHPKAHDESVRFLARSIYENGYSAGLHEHTADFAASDSYWPLIRTAQALIGQGWQQK